MSSKSVLITGCSVGGIGHALVVAFQERGLTVFATARNVSKMKDLESLPNVHLLALDVTSPTSVAAAAKHVEVETGGRLDYLVNNAGVQHVMPVLDVNIEDAKETFEANLWGPVRMVQEFSPMIIAAKGTVVNVASVAALLHIPLQSIYDASKAAMMIVSETMRLELAPFGVKVVTLMAGNVLTSMAGTTDVKLPPNSRYLSLQEEIGKSEYSNMNVTTFATSVVGLILSGAQGKIWKGNNATIVRLLEPTLPTFVLDKLMITNGRGIAKLKKQ